MPAKPPALLPTPLRTVGENIKFYREQKGVTQTALSFILGNKTDGGAFISRLERDVQQPRLSTLRKLAAALDVDVNKLFQK